MDRRPGSALVLAAALAAPLAAQALTSGTLEGRVQATDGTPIPGARLTFQESRTHRKVHLASGPDGRFRIRGLEPGLGTLRVAAEGYGTQRITGLWIHPDASAEVPVELIPMESEMVMDVEGGNAPVDPAGGALTTTLPGSLIRALPLRERSLRALADLGPWPAPPAGDLRVDGLDRGSAGVSPSPVGPESLAEVQILAGGAAAGQADAASIRATTRGGGNAFAGEAQALWSPASWSSAPDGDRSDTSLAVSGPLRTDRLFYAVAADRFRPEPGTGATRGSLRMDWLPDDTQRWTLAALGSQATGPGAGRDASLALGQRWTPRPDLVQEFRVQARTVEAPGLGPAHFWEAADALAMDLGPHGLRAGVDLRQVRSDALPGAAWRQRGLFLQDDWRIAAPFTLRLGLRQDREDLDASGGTAAAAREATSPRLAFTWQTSDRVRIYGGHGRFVDPSPLVFFPPLPTLPEAPPDRRESHLGLAFLPLPDLVLSVEGRAAEGRLLPGGSGRDRFRGLALGGRWQVREVLSLAASWTVGRTDTLLPAAGIAPGAATLHRLRLWAEWDTRDLATPWARDWTLALVGRVQSGVAEAAEPGLPADPTGAAILDLRLARTLPGARNLRVSVLLDAFDLLDRTRIRPGTPVPADAGRRVQLGLRAAF